MHAEQGSMQLANAHGAQKTPQLLSRSWGWCRGLTQGLLKELWTGIALCPKWDCLWEEQARWEHSLSFNVFSWEPRHRPPPLSCEKNVSKVAWVATDPQSHSLGCQVSIQEHSMVTARFPPIPKAWAAFCQIHRPVFGLGFRWDRAFLCPSIASPLPLQAKLICYHWGDNQTWCTFRDDRASGDGQYGPQHLLRSSLRVMGCPCVMEDA